MIKGNNSNEEKKVKKRKRFNIYRNDDTNINAFITEDNKYIEGNDDSSSFEPNYKSTDFNKNPS